MRRHNALYRLLFGSRADWLDFVVPVIFASISAWLAMLKPVQQAIDAVFP